MPGGPVETLIGTSALGAGVLVVYAAYKNRNPLQIVRDAITSGKFPDLSKMSPLFGSNSNPSIPGPDTKAIIDPIRAKDPDLANRLEQAINAYSANPDEAGQAGLLILLAEVNQKGFKTEGKALLDWINAHPTSGIGRQIVPNPLNVQPTDNPSGNDNQGVIV